MSTRQKPPETRYRSIRVFRQNEQTHTGSGAPAHSGAMAIRSNPRPINPANRLFSNTLSVGKQQPELADNPLAGDPGYGPADDHCGNKHHVSPHSGAIERKQMGGQNDSQCNTDNDPPRILGKQKVEKQVSRCHSFLLGRRIIGCRQRGLLLINVDNRIDLRGSTLPKAALAARLGIHGKPFDQEFGGVNIISILRFLLRPLSFSLDASGR